MAVPSKKSEGIEKHLDSLTPNEKGRRGAIKDDECTWCGKKATSFRDELSEKEYTISGFCQECQDKTFGR